MNRRLKRVTTFAAEAESEGGNDSGETPAADEFKAITSQEDLNKVVSERVARERAKYVDYKDLKAKAAKLDEFEQANQTEAEKTAKRVAELEAELSDTRRESLRLKIASAHGITDADDIDLFLTGNDEETLAKQAKRLAERQAPTEQPKPDIDLDLGTRTTATTNLDPKSRDLAQIEADLKAAKRR